jgi:hypothetical protein
MDSPERCANTTFKFELQVSKQATASVPRASKREDFMMLVGRKMRRDANAGFRRGFGENGVRRIQYILPMGLAQSSRR